MNWTAKASTWSNVTEVEENPFATVILIESIESWLKGFDPEKATAKVEAKRLRSNRNRRERYQAMRSLGLKKTPYGWE